MSTAMNPPKNGHRCQGCACVSVLKGVLHVLASVFHFGFGLIALTFRLGVMVAGGVAQPLFCSYPRRLAPRSWLCPLRSWHLFVDWSLMDVIMPAPAPIEASRGFLAGEHKDDDQGDDAEEKP